MDWERWDVGHVRERWFLVVGGSEPCFLVLLFGCSVRIRASDLYK